jgi:long-subunit acyl-CoA synthetase (AMP-forming)
MGSTHLDKIIEYNKYEDINHKKGEDYAGPFLFPKVKDFQKETVEHFQDKSLIGYNIEKMKKFKDRPCLGRRLITGRNEKGEPIFEKKYTYYTYNDVYKMCQNFAKNIHEKREELIYRDSYRGKNFDLIGIFAKNCTEWVVSDMGCQMDSITTATLYATLGKEAFKYICEQTKIKCILVSPDLVKMLCEFKSMFKLEQLKSAILFDMTTDCDPEQELKKLREAGFIAYSFKNDFVKENTTVNEKDLNLSNPDTILTIC